MVSGVSRKIDMSYLILLFLFILNLYSPEIKGFEISIGYNILIIAVSFKKMRLRISKFNFSVLLIFLIVFFWSLMTLVLSSNEDIVILLGRNLRFVFFALTIILIINTYQINSTQLLRIVRIALFINVIFVILQMIFPGLKYVMGKYFEIDVTKIYSIRAFGLFSGYDYAGFICLISFILNSLFLYNSPKFKYFIYTLVSFVSVFFTSRFTMVFAIIYVAAYFIILFNKLELTYKLISLIVIIFIFIQIRQYILPLLSMSLPGLNFNSNNVDSFFVYNYSVDSIHKLLNEMVSFPSGIYFYIGEGFNPRFSDIGWVKLIYLYGMIGTLFILLSTFFMFFLIINQRLNNLKSILDFRILSRFLMIYFILIVLFNFKILFLFTSRINELTILLLVSSYQAYKNNEIDPVHKE